jgi:hypothetical protein
MPYPCTVAFDDRDFNLKLPELLKHWGVVVITDVFSPEECEESMNHLVNYVEELSDGFDHKNPKDTWIKERIPPAVRDGLFQCMIGNLPAVTAIRADPRVQKIFTIIYSNLRGKPVTEFVSSLDGVNIRPPVPPYYNESMTDWAHIDISRRDAMFECVQGQVVLTSTSASFRCSPRSHLIYEKLLFEYGSGEHAAEWCMFNTKYYDQLAKEVEAIGGKWQIPIIVPIGSMILWFSSTIHSARLQSPPETIKLVEGKWKDWRGVIYTCLRPKDEIDDDHIFRLKSAYRNNLCTNHWGKKIFSTTPATQKKTVYVPKIREFMSRPSRVYEIFPKSLNPRWLKLIGYKDGIIDAELERADIERDNKEKEVRYPDRGFGRGGGGYGRGGGGYGRGGGGYGRGGGGYGRGK